MAEKDKSPKEFYDLLTAFISALSETFDDCSVLQSKLKLIKACSTEYVWKSAVSEWRTRMTEENLALMKAKDSRLFVDVFDKHPLLSDIKFSEKWLDPELGDDSREVIWWYLSELARVSLPYDKRPTRAEKKKRKKMPKQTTPEVERLVRSFCARHGIRFDEETGDVNFNYKKIMETDAINDPDITLLRAHVGL